MSKDGPRRSHNGTFFLSFFSNSVATSRIDIPLNTLIKAPLLKKAVSGREVEPDLSTVKLWRSNEFVMPECLLSRLRAHLKSGWSYVPFGGSSSLRAPGYGRYGLEESRRNREPGKACLHIRSRSSIGKSPNRGKLSSIVGTVEMTEVVFGAAVADSGSLE